MLRRLFAWLTWQRVAVGAMRIDRPRFETLVITLYAVAYVALSAATAWMIRRHPLPLVGAAAFTHDASYVLGFKIAALLLLPWVMLRAWGYRARDLLPGWRPSPRAAAIAALGFSLGASLNLWHLDRLVPALAALPPPQGLLLVSTGTLLPLLSAALPEELVYRGLLHTRLEATLGRAAAIVLGSLLFAAWHLPSRYLLADGVEGRAGDLGSVVVGTGIPVLIVGLVFAWLWDRYRDLPLLVAVHWGIDLLPSMSSVLGIRF